MDNRQWLPAHVEDSWDPDDDMRLMRSVFGHRYMITDGWGRDLLPPDNAGDFAACPAGDGKSVGDKGGGSKKRAREGGDLWEKRMEPWPRGERPGR